MKPTHTPSPLEVISNATVDRRNFMRKASLLGIGAAASGVLLTSQTAAAATPQVNSYQRKDTITEIFTAFLIAEDLATTFYYNGLVGAVIQDPNLAGSGGSATHPSASGNAGNVDYLRAALSEEISHADLFRGGLGLSSPAADPYQTFYFPNGTFSTLSSFLGILNALENAFIGAYLTLIQELSYKAALARAGQLTGADARYSASEYEYFAQVAASILGIEAEHRVLGRVIGNENPANNLAYEQLDGIMSIYNGPNSAVAALTPFLTPSTGPGFSLATALANQSSISLPASGNPPAE